MYGVPGMPDLLQPAGPFQDGPARYAQDMGDNYSWNPFRHDSPPVRLHRRAPKLGQIGRSKKVDIEDENLDNMLNASCHFPVPVSPVA